MTQPDDSGMSPPLDASDPRLSEWIDGRLPAAEAAAVERAVAASPALTRLVADLEAIRQAARLAPAASPPAEFVDRVMDAVAAAPVAGGDDAEADRAVQREWQAVETERLAEERAEAEADLVSPAGAPLATPGRVWPWLAIGSALAAGLLATVVINRPAENLREVAQVVPRAAARPAPEAAKTSGGAGAVLQPPAPAAVPAAVAPAASTTADEKFAAADMPPSEQLARSRALSRPKPGPAADAGGEDKPAKGEVAAGERATEERGEAERDLGRMAAVPGPAELLQSDAANGRNAAQDVEAPEPGQAREPGPLVLKVASWTDFDRLLEAHELEAKPLDSEGGSADRAEHWRLEISGESAAIEAFLAAATDGRRRREEQTSRADAGDPQPEARKQADALEEKDARKRSDEPADAAGAPRRAAQRKLVVILRIEPPPDGEVDPGKRTPPAAEKGADP